MNEKGQLDLDQNILIKQQKEKIERLERHAEIENALNNVRDRAVQMKTSAEIKDVVAIVFHELQKLGFELSLCNIETMDISSGDIDVWCVTRRHTYPTKIHLPYFDHPVLNSVQEAMNEGVSFLTNSFNKKEKDRFHQRLYQLAEFAETPDELKKRVFESKALGRSIYIGTYANLAVYNYDGKLYTADQNYIIRKIGKTFDEVYTRFLDLQNAEAQAREAQIEIALERVRSSTMAMHRSEELLNVVLELYKQMDPFGLATFGCTIKIFEEESNRMQNWFAEITESDLPQCYYIEGQDHPGIQFEWDVWRQQLPNATAHYKGEEKHDFVHYLMTQTDYRDLPEVAKQAITSEDEVYLNYCSMRFGLLGTVDLQPISEENQSILYRFAKVFEQTYTRFLDLQKAEAQVREARIESALERVRSRTMAMHESIELKKTATLLLQQVKELGIDLWNCGFHFWIKDQAACTAYVSTPSGKFQDSFTYSLDVDPVLINIYEAFQRGEEFYEEELNGKALIDHNLYMASIPSLAEIVKEYEESGLVSPESKVMNCVFIQHGFLLFITTKPQPEFWDIFKRFGKVFEQTYTRYLDLQKAEAQAREAQIEVALERVRSRTMAMQTSEELSDLATVLFKQFEKFGASLWTSGFVLLDKKDPEGAFRVTNPEGEVQPPIYIPHSDDPITRHMYENWVKGTDYYSEAAGGPDLKAHYDYLLTLPRAGHVIESVKGAGISLPTWQQWHAAYFSYGYLMVITLKPFEEVNLLKRFAQQFEQSYIRFLDLKKNEEQAIRIHEEKIRLEKTLKDLRTTQKQLIQSEKMASLGELTAGIAHEIKNPLNFVNNFAEVSGEMLEELQEELSEENSKEVREIVSDIHQNLEKIQFHGKRADSIVKSMLEHSRRSDGTKQLTDINTLVDEYLRLAYHGMRAKDKSFNAAIQSEYDSNVQKINLVPQEIGRVVMNIITNALHAVSKRKEEENDEYKPTIWVSTIRVGTPLGEGGEQSHIQISIKDNGGGIPEDIQSKIFQPFFTTKPTGQGTGLGLSLSYDIVKAHNGDIVLESQDGKGATFYITLPNDNEA